LRWMTTYKRLTVAEPEEMSRQVAAGYGDRAIARQLGRAPSTMTRELHRAGMTARTYRAAAAHRAAATATHTPRGPRKLVVNGRLTAYVHRRLAQRWSPEQIAKWLRTEYPEDATMRVSHETSSTALASCLAANSSEGCWPPCGIGGSDGRADGPATSVRRAFAREVRTLPQQLRRSLTYDRGTEMAQHTRFTHESRIRVFFAHPHSPWGRGTNENTNGLIRQFFPKGTDFSQVSRCDIKHDQALLNGRSRKELHWRTPSEVFHGHLVALET